MKKIKNYVLIVSVFFPKTHSKAGTETEFINSILNLTKKHTIRGNYILWEKRIEEIQKGNAVLSIRSWTGKPYKSKQEEVCILDKNSGIGIQKLEFKTAENNQLLIVDNCRVVPKFNLSENDGLSLNDFEEWFKKYDLTKPMAIIHFTKIRY